MAANAYKKANLNFLNNLPLDRGLAFGVIIITALLAFEIFNYGTTDYALTDLLGPLSFLGLRWATILAIAFCGIDFAGIARLFAPELGSMAHNESRYLFGAWLLAATMNAMLTWWGVTLAILNNQAAGNAVIERATILRAAPIFVAILVWLIRVLIIGTFSVAGDRLFTVSGGARQAARPGAMQQNSAIANRPASNRPVAAAPAPVNAAAAPRKAPVTLTPISRPSQPASAPANTARPSQAAPRASFSPAFSAPEPDDPPELEYTPIDFTAQTSSVKVQNRPGEPRDPRATPSRWRS